MLCVCLCVCVCVCVFIQQRLMKNREEVQKEVRGVLYQLGLMLGQPSAIIAPTLVVCCMVCDGFYHF